MKRIAVIGNDGRAAAITRRLLNEGHRLYVTPGNAGMTHWAGITLWPAGTFPDTIARVKAEGCELTIVSPEQPLAEGIVDAFTAAGLPIVGPTKEAARIESSKEFSAELFFRAKVPAPGFASFDLARQAKGFIRTQKRPYVIKADGLMAGKGVRIAANAAEADTAIDELIAHGPIVIQEYLEGQECSFQVVTDGHYAVALLPSRDYKRAQNGDVGDNTGGMGSYAPYSLNEATQKTIMNTIVYPTLKCMRDINIPYRGILYFGLMLTSEGPKVLEANARLGDPETESILPLLRTSFYELLLATTKENLLAKIPVAWTPGYCVTVALTAEGYPTAPRKGDVITGIDKAESARLAEIYPAGMALNPEGKFVTGGGRVVYVTGSGKSLTEARTRAYTSAHMISFKGVHYRTDIAAKSVAAMNG